MPYSNWSFRGDAEQNRQLFATFLRLFKESERDPAMQNLWRKVLSDIDLSDVNQIFNNLDKIEQRGQSFLLEGHTRENIYDASISSIERQFHYLRKYLDDIVEIINLDNEESHQVSFQWLWAYTRLALDITDQQTYSLGAKLDAMKDLSTILQIIEQEAQQILSNDQAKYQSFSSQCTQLRNVVSNICDKLEKNYNETRITGRIQDLKSEVDYFSEIARSCLQANNNLLNQASSGSESDNQNENMEREFRMLPGVLLSFTKSGKHSQLLEGIADKFRQLINSECGPQDVAHYLNDKLGCNWFGVDNGCITYQDGYDDLCSIHQLVKYWGQCLDHSQDSVAAKINHINSLYADYCASIARFIDLSEGLDPLRRSIEAFGEIYASREDPLASSLDDMMSFYKQQLDKLAQASKNYYQTINILANQIKDKIDYDNDDHAQNIIENYVGPVKHLNNTVQSSLSREHSISDQIKRLNNDKRYWQNHDAPYQQAYESMTNTFQSLNNLVREANQMEGTNFKGVDVNNLPGPSEAYQYIDDFFRNVNQRRGQADSEESDVNNRSQAPAAEGSASSHSPNKGPGSG